MVVCRWQTVEDGPPRDRVEIRARHIGHVTEHVFAAVPVRHPFSHHVMRTHLVIRVPETTGVAGVTLETYDPGDDGA